MGLIYLMGVLKMKEFNTENYKFNQHRACEFFPCHEVSDDSTFNCLFCYCPLYALGEKCGGNFEYVAGGVKDCSNCKIPHNPKGYDYIMSKYPEIMELAKKK